MSQSQQEHAALKRLQQTHECGACGPQSHLEVRWWQGSYSVWCPRCRAVDGFRKRQSITAAWRENPANVDVATANRLAEKHAKDIDAVVTGLPPELAAIVRQRYEGLPIPMKKDEE